MNKKYSKLNIFVQKKTYFSFFSLIIFVSFVFPNLVSAYDVSSIISTAKGFGYDTSQVETYLSAGQKAGIDLSTTEKIKSYLNNEVRNTAKAGFDLTRSGFNTVINGPDSLLGFDMTEKKKAAREGLAQLDLAEKQTNEKINNTLGQINKAENMYGLINTVGKIPQVLGLIDEIKALGKGGANPAQALGTIEKIGSLVGFTVPADLKQGIGMLSGMSGGMEGAASTIQGLLGGAGGFSNRAASSFAGVTGGASAMMAEAAGAGGIAAQASGSVGKAADTMAQNQNIANQNQQTGQNVCDNTSNDSGGDSGSDGVPVIEQAGALLGSTKTIAKVTTQTRHISQKTCEYTKGILEIQTKWWKKVSEDDPKAAMDAKAKVKKEADDYSKFLSDGRKTSDNPEQKKNLYPTIDEYVDEEAKAGRNDFMSKLENSKVSQKIKDTLLKTFQQQNEIEDEDEANYKAGTASTQDFDADNFVKNPPKGSAFWEGFITLAEPRNNLAGQYILQLQEKEKIVSKYVANAEQTWNTFQILPKQECVKEVTSKTTGKTTCAKWQNVTPAKIVADTASTFADSGTLMTIQTDQDGEEKGEKKYVEDTTEKVSGIGPDDIAVEENTSSSQYGKGNFMDSMNEICSLIPSVCEKITSGLSGGNESGNEPEQTQNPTAPAPTIIMRNDGTTDTGEGLKKTKISWSTTNAVSCIADNNWVSYSINNKATTSPTIMKIQDDDIETVGSFEVFHPAIFSYKVSASGPTGSIAQTAENSFNTSGGVLTQTLTFKPNIAGLSARDIVFLWLNGLSVSVDGSANEDEVPTRTDINERLSKAIDLLIQKGTSSGIEFSKYNKSTAFDALIISRRTSAFALNNEYKMTCYNSEGDSAERSIRVDFFR